MTHLHVKPLGPRTRHSSPVPTNSIRRPLRASPFSSGRPFAQFSPRIIVFRFSKTEWTIAKRQERIVKTSPVRASRRQLTEQPDSTRTVRRLAARYRVAPPKNRRPLCTILRTLCQYATCCAMRRTRSYCSPTQFCESNRAALLRVDSSVGNCRPFTLPFSILERQ